MHVRVCAKKHKRTNKWPDRMNTVDVKLCGTIVGHIQTSVMLVLVHASA
jgi:hypothetical protein